MPSVDFNQIARIAKLVALLGFLLPWVTVSCSGTDILHATGVQLMTGHPEPVGPLAMGHSQLNDEAHPAFAVIAAFGLILIGLVCSLFARKQTAAATLLVAAVLGIGTSYYSMQNLHTELTRQIEHQQHKQQPVDTGGLLSADQQREMTQSIAASIKVDEQEGYWVTMVALAVAALFALMTLMVRREPAPSD